MTAPGWPKNVHGPTGHCSGTPDGLSMPGHRPTKHKDISTKTCRITLTLHVNDLTYHQGEGDVSEFQARRLISQFHAVYRYL